MKIENGIIVEMTRAEAYDRWTGDGYDEIFPFDEYLKRIILAGCRIIYEDKDGEQNERT